MLLDPPLDPNERFRERRRRTRRRRTIRRLAALALAAVAAAAAALGTRPLTGSEPEAARETAQRARPAAKSAAAAPAVASQPTGLERRLPPAEIRGVHVTMPLASLEGKLDEYLELRSVGLNAIEVDVKDENGEVAFVRPRVQLAQRIGAATPYYDPREVARAAERSGLYLIGRVVVFEDPVLAEKRPELAVLTRSGAVWKTAVGLAWTNPYDERVWKYNVDVAEAAVRAGFDEIMFDYIRFPTDGQLADAVFRGRVAEPRARTIARFLAYAVGRLRPLGAQVSVAVFGLSATRNLGIGQNPRLLARWADAVYPMVYPSHYGAGELGLDNPDDRPRQVVAITLSHFQRALRGRDVRLVPWLQDFSLLRAYSEEDVQAEVAAARAFGAHGFVLWNSSGLYTTTALQAR